MTRGRGRDRKCRSRSAARPMPATSPTARPRSSASTFSATGLLLRRIAEGQSDLLGGMLGMARRLPRAKNRCSGQPYFCLVDEADSILIDEARTPLIISALPTEAQKIAVQCLQVGRLGRRPVRRRRGLRVRPREEDGRADAARAGRRSACCPSREAMDTVGMVNIYQYIERAIMVDREYHPRPAVRRPRRRDRDRRRVHRPAGRGPQVARRHPPGRRGQGRRRGHRRNRPGRADHRAGLLPALRAPGRHDRHGDRARPASCDESTAAT